jgi:flagellar biosynthesis/type III secretory pathway protein FliH
MEACKPLFEYAWIVQAVRDNLNQSDKQDKEALVEAIAKMIHDIPDDFILKPFLVSHHAEIVSMLLTEYDEVEAMNLFRLEGKLEGLKEGKLEGLKEGKLEGLKEGKLEGLKEGKLEGLKEGKLEGLKEGKRELNSIYCKLIQEGRMDELQNAISDPAYLEELAKEFTHAESPNKSGES